MTRAQNSIFWFEEALEYSTDDYEDRGTAKAYISIGEFYRDIQSKVDKGKDKGMYKPLFDNLSEIIKTIALNTKESDKVRLDVLELARSAIHQYSTGFKRDGISQIQIENMLNDVERCVNGVSNSTAKIEEMKTSIKALFGDTKAAVDAAYGTSKGG